MHIQVQWQVVCFQNQLETIGKCAGIHRFAVRLAEQVVILIHSFICCLRSIPLALFSPRLEQLAHFFAQIYHAITAGRLRVFRDGLLVTKFYYTALYMDGTLSPVDIAPSQPTGLTSA